MQQPLQANTFKNPEGNPECLVSQRRGIYSDNTEICFCKRAKMRYKHPTS